MTQWEALFRLPGHKPTFQTIIGCPSIFGNHYANKQKRTRDKQTCPAPLQVPFVYTVALSRPDAMPYLFFISPDTYSFPFLSFLPSSLVLSSKINLLYFLVTLFFTFTVILCN